MGFYHFDELHDPHAIEDYSIDWSAWLNGDTIQTSAWEVVEAAGITLEDDPAPSYTATATTVWVSGGTNGYSCVLTNMITTVGGRTEQRTVVIDVEDE